MQKQSDSIFRIPWNFDNDEDVPDDSPAFSDQSANVGSPAQTKKSCRISTLKRNRTLPL